MYEVLCLTEDEVAVCCAGDLCTQQAYLTLHFPDELEVANNYELLGMRIFCVSNCRESLILLKDDPLRDLHK